MFRIRRIFDDHLPANRHALEQVRQILSEQFPDLRVGEAEKLHERVRAPFRFAFQSYLFVAEEWRGRVLGFALLLHAPELEFCLLDYISAARRLTGRGVGGALYDRVREQARQLQAKGLFFECLPDDPALSHDPKVRTANAARLRFYERWGARPIAGTAYETPVHEGDDNPPYLVFDDLGTGRPLRRRYAQAVVQVILERKYANLCSPEYIDRVVASIRDDPVRLAPRRSQLRAAAARPQALPDDELILLVVNERHAIHHVRERGYVEAPVRISSILKELQRTNLFRRMEPRRFSERNLQAVHDRDYLSYLRRVCLDMEEGRSVYPYVFPIRNRTRPPRELAVRAGYYCLDTFTPLNRNAYLAARRGVDCALTAARAIGEGRRLAYALIRPPGHHAERRAFGGFCYLNSVAAAAQLLSHVGPVAVLDVDFHHGNGQQEIFAERPDVLTLSIHGHPRFAYPYFSGFEHETGRGAGVGSNLNIPLGELVDGDTYRQALARALRRVIRHRAQFLVVALGLDTGHGDPTGSWSLRARDFERNGELIGRLGLPTLVVQEGGYDTRVLGAHARCFFNGLWKGAHTPPRGRDRRTPAGHGSAGDRHGTGSGD